jgi:hypothetical protein
LIPSVILDESSSKSISSEESARDCFWFSFMVRAVIISANLNRIDVLLGQILFW